jgi:hypothetical protein
MTKNRKFRTPDMACRKPVRFLPQDGEVATEYCM